MEILCFYAGIAFVYLEQTYSLLFLLCLLCFRLQLRFIAAFLLGIGIVCFHEWCAPERSFGNATALSKVTILGSISAIPSRQKDRLQIRMDIISLNDAKVNFSAVLTCYRACPVVYVGEKWRFLASLKKPQFPGNPGEFNYHAFLRARHIDWLGTIQANHSQLVETRKASFFNLLILREKLGLLLEQLFPEEAILGIVQALTLEITTHIDQPSWELFRRTGIIHLMGISGAHISLVVGLIFKLVHWCWSRSSWLCLRLPAPSVSGAFALLIGFFYSLLAGLGVPVERAIISCSLIFFRYFCSQRLCAWQAWRYALALVLLLEPHAVFLTGFYLSFIAVAILLLVNQCFTVRGIRKLIIIQLACMFGLMPLCIYWFSYGSINGLAANFLAIPWVELWIVPLCLLTLLVSYFIEVPLLISLVKKSILILLSYIHWIDQFSFFNIQWSLISIFSVLVLMGAMLVLFCIPLKHFQIVAILMTVAALFPSTPSIKEHQCVIDVLDVGQGLAVLVRTAHHTLMYDTGMKFFNGTDFGKRIILPYLHRIGVDTLDTIVISHPDLDHRGGLKTLQAEYPKARLIVDNPSFYHQGMGCHTSRTWTWNGIHFEFLPIKARFNTTNNHSCILKITTQGTSMLLTGDIEKAAETYLIRHYKDKLKADVLLIPHHGSKTSSSVEFVATVNPRMAIASYALHNQYHFPHKKAMEVYRQQHVELYNTAEFGMISVTLSAKNKVEMKHFRTCPSGGCKL